MNSDLVWKFQQLPAQQKLVVKSILKDVPEKEIAFQLSLSRKTVNHYCRLVYKKFGVNSRYGLILSFASDSATLKVLDNL